jgi:hypothetical protein
MPRAHQQDQEDYIVNRTSCGFVKAALAVGAVVMSLVTTMAQHKANGHVVLTPTELMWGPPPPSLKPGAKLAVLSGHPGATGPFAIRLKLPAGYRIAPHSHPTDEQVTVLSGVLAVGMGETFEPRRTKDLPAGGYMLMPAEMIHFAMAKGDVVIQVNGTGPFVINYVNPSDDPSRQKR